MSGKNLTAHWTRLVDSGGRCSDVPSGSVLDSAQPLAAVWLPSQPTLGWLPGVFGRCHSARHNPTELGNHNFCVTRCQTVDPCGGEVLATCVAIHGGDESHMAKSNSTASSTLGTHHLGHTFGRPPPTLVGTCGCHWACNRPDCSTGCVTSSFPRLAMIACNCTTTGHVRWPLLHQDARTWLHRRPSRRCCPPGSTAVRGDAVKCVATPTTVGARAATNVDTMRKKNT